MRTHSLLAFAACFLFSRAEPIAAFYTGGGPVMVSLDPAGNFLYNVHSKTGFSDMKTFTPTIPPKNGTSIACVGYGSSSIYGSIFYQTANNSIAHQIFKCSYTSGNCVNYGGYLVSGNVTLPIRPGTGLGAVLLSADLGYRVTYEDIYGSIRQIGYSNSTKGIVTPWSDGVRTINSTGNGSLAMTYVGSPNSTTPAQQTIFQVSNDSILSFNDNNVTAMNQSQSWISAPSVTNLPSWYSGNATFSPIIYTPWLLIFYVDMTRQLQLIRSTDGGQTWKAQAPMETSIWPLADTPNAPVAAASSVNASDNSASVFYVSGGKVIQSVMTNYTWMPYTVVQAPLNITNFIAPFQGEDRDVKIGASVGSVGFLILVGIAFCVCRGIRRKRVIELEGGESGGSCESGEMGFSGKAELHGQSYDVTELDHDPECLLFHQLQLIRIQEMNGEIPVELQSSEVRAELDHSLCKCELDASMMYELPCGSLKAISVKELSSWTKEEKDEEMGGNGTKECC